MSGRAERDESREPPERVVVIDDHDMMRDGLVLGLDRRPDIDIVGSGGSIADYLAGVDRWQPTVAVVDHRLPDGVGTEIGRLNADADPPVRTIVITGLDRVGLIHDVIAAGCHGLLNKTVPISYLADAVITVGRGGTAFDGDLLRELALPDRTIPGATLTLREREILGLLAEAKTAEVMAADLHLSVNTVRNHISSILSKLNANSQLEAVIIAQRAGLV